MNLRQLQSLIFFGILTASVTSIAVQVTLKHPKEYRKKVYATFETKKVVKLALIALRDAVEESEPENAQLINQALVDGNFKKQVNVVYFDPPLEYGGDQLPQFYIYTKSDEFNVALQGVLWAAMHSPHSAAYSKAIERLKGVMEIRGIKELENDEKVVSKRISVRKRARAHSPTRQPEVKRNAVDHAPEQDPNVPDFDFQFDPDDDWGKAEIETWERMVFMLSGQNSN